MMDRKAEPEIRFKGFTDSWEQRKLGDVYSERNERGNVELDILSVSIHHGISQNELDTDELGKSVRRSDDKSLYKHVYYGDLVFNMMRAWQGAIGVVKNEGMVSPAYISAIPDDSVFPEFMDYCLRRKRIINQINNLSYGVTDFRKRLYWEPFTRVTIMMPSVDEQRKITDIFHQLDDLITLHQRKCDKLCDFKKALLCNMFPAAEADAPKVRFKGYTKPWKHWTLGELYTERKEAGNDDLPILSVSIHSGVSADELDSAELGKAVRRSEDKSLYKHTYKGDLVFNMMRAWQGAIGVVPKEGMVSPAYITAIPNDEVFPEFMDYCLRREEVINQINNLSYGVTDFRKRLYWDSFVRVQIMLPSVEEQKKITATLVQLDGLIELQSAKVEKLKNLKAACLEKMFV
jgi:type I restriction enzyme S subunit